MKPGDHIHDRCPCGRRLDLARGPEHKACRGEALELPEHPNEAHNARVRARRRKLMDFAKLTQEERELILEAEAAVRRQGK